MLPNHLFRHGLAVSLALVLAACGNYETATNNSDEPADAGQSEQHESNNGGDQAAGTEKMTEGNIDQMSLEQAVDAALQDVAERGGVTPENISVVEARRVTWRNGALGCPEEGMMYTQALVEGFYILLSDGDGEYAYHAGRDGKPFLCPAERSQPPAERDLPES